MCVFRSLHVGLNAVSAHFYPSVKGDKGILGQYSDAPLCAYVIKLFISYSCFTVILRYLFNTAAH